MGARSLSDALHDRLAQMIARTRFPFEGQSDWPTDYVTIVNADAKTRAIPGPNGPHFPDIIIVDGNDEVREVGEVELAADVACVPIWRAGSAAADDHTDSGDKHFFVYVPAGQETLAKSILDDHGISYAGVRGWIANDDGSLEIVPFVTPGEAKDHKPTRSA